MSAAQQVAQQFGLDPAAVTNEQTFLGAITQFITDTVQRMGYASAEDVRVELSEP